MKNRSIWMIAIVLAMILLTAVSCQKDPVIHGDGGQTSGGVQSLPETVGDTNSPETVPTGTNGQETTQPDPTLQKHTVIFDYNDGSGQTMEVEVPHGSTIEEYAPVLSFADKEVRCWSSLQQGESYIATITADITLYAQWISQTYTIRLDAGQGSIAEGDSEIVIKHGEMIVSLPGAAMENCLFVGWKLPDGTYISDGVQVKSAYSTFTAEVYMPVDREVVLSAEYQLIQRTITYDFQDPAITNQTVSVAHGTTIDPTQHPRLDTGVREVVGWSQSATEIVEFDGTVTADVTLYPIWRNYRMVLLHQGGTMGIKNVKVYEEDELDLTSYAEAMTNKHHTAHGWYDNAEFTGEPVSAVAYETVAEAYYFRWIPEEYRIQFDTVSAGAEFDSVTYSYGAMFKLPVPEKKGYTFTGWCRNADLSGDKITAIEATHYGDMTLYASFQNNTYKLTLNANGGEVNQASETVVYDKTYVLPVPTRKGYTFAGWYNSPDRTIQYTNNNGQSIRPYNAEEGMELYAGWTLLTYAEYRETEGVIHAWYDGYKSAWGNVYQDGFEFDFDALYAEGYRCRITIQATVQGIEKCYVTCMIRDKSGNRIAYTGDEYKLVSAGKTYDFSYAVDNISALEFSDDYIQFRFKAEPNGLFDANNEYKAYNFIMKFEFHK